jgi:peptidoglycan/LPS O-acetylase OafA/YrhL
MDKKLPGLQIARAIAALSVMYFHSWTALDRFPKGTAHPLPILTEYGWVGVDLFFAISGFVICLVISKPGFDPRSFLIKRAWRIYPLWLLCLTTFAVMSRVWRAPMETETMGYFLWSATLLPTHEFPFYAIGWSLQHEMMFYLIVIIVVPWLGIVGLVAALAVSTLGYWTIEMPWYWQSLAMYHAEFLAGILAFLLRPAFLRFGAMPPLLIGASLLYFFTTGSGGRPFFPLALFFLMVGFSNIRDGSPIVGAAEAMGDASYSIYLLHPLVLLIAKSATALVSLPIWMQEPIRWSCMAITIAISLCCWRFLERPAVALGNSLIGKPRVN